MLTRAECYWLGKARQLSAEWLTRGGRLVRPAKDSVRFVFATVPFVFVVVLFVLVASGLALISKYTRGGECKRREKGRAEHNHVKNTEPGIADFAAII
jgi:hypothetical protein